MGNSDTKCFDAIYRVYDNATGAYSRLSPNVYLPAVLEKTSNADGWRNRVHPHYFAMQAPQPQMVLEKWTGYVGRNEMLVFEGDYVRLFYRNHYIGTGKVACKSSGLFVMVYVNSSEKPPREFMIENLRGKDWSVEVIGNVHHDKKQVEYLAEVKNANR